MFSDVFHGRPPRAIRDNLESRVKIAVLAEKTEVEALPARVLGRVRDSVFVGDGAISASGSGPHSPAEQIRRALLKDVQTIDDEAEEIVEPPPRDVAERPPRG